MIDYLIASNELGLEENEIIRIAWEAVRRRRQAPAKRGNQLQLNGTKQETGYVTYEDYERYMEERKQREQLRFGWDIGRIMLEIINTLFSKGWTASRGHRERRFYPPRLGLVDHLLLEIQGVGQFPKMDSTPVMLAMKIPLKAK